MRPGNKTWVPITVRLIYHKDFILGYWLNNYKTEFNPFSFADLIFWGKPSIIQVTLSMLYFYKNMIIVKIIFYSSQYISRYKRPRKMYYISNDWELSQEHAEPFKFVLALILSELRPSKEVSFFFRSDLTFKFLTNC